MDISTHHLAAAGVALLCAGAVAFTPVGPSLEGMILQNETVAPIEPALLPDWLTQAAADLAERIGDSPAMPGGDGRNVPSLPWMPAEIAGAQFPGVMTEEAGTPPPLNAVPEAVLRAAASPMPAPQSLPDLFMAVESLVNTALNPVTGAVTEAITGTIGELTRILRTVAADAMATIVLSVPLLVAGQLVDSLASIFNTWLELRGNAGAAAHLGPVSAPDPISAPASPRSRAVPAAMAMRDKETAGTGTDSRGADVNRPSTPGGLQSERHRPRSTVGGVTGVGVAAKGRSISTTALGGDVAATVASAHGHGDTPADARVPAP